MNLNILNKFEKNNLNINLLIRNTIVEDYMNIIIKYKLSLIHDFLIKTIFNTALHLFKINYDLNKLYDIDINNFKYIKSFYHLEFINYDIDILPVINIHLDKYTNILLDEYLLQTNNNKWYLYTSLEFYDKINLSNIINIKNISYYENEYSDIYNSKDQQPDNDDYNIHEFIKVTLSKKIKEIDIKDNIKNLGSTSLIKMFKIDNNEKKRIESEINYKLNNNIIVQKRYIDTDNIWINRLGGKKIQYNNEIMCLKKLYKKKHFPLLLFTNMRKFTFIMDYCGVPLNDKNLPDDWKKQIKQIVKTLYKLNIFSNDMWKNNFLVRDNILILIDFGWGADRRYFPYINIKYNDIDKYSDLFELMDNTIKLAIVNKKYFRESKIWKKKN